MTKARRKQSMLALVVSAFFVLITFGIQNTYAALQMKSETVEKKSKTVENSFSPMENKAPQINEIVSGNDNYITEKKDVTVTNNNDFSVKVRAIIIASWQDANGNTLAVTPVEGTDYSIEYGNDWENKDGFYYYKTVLKKGEMTSALISECKPLKAAPVEGYTLSINIVSQTIQSKIDNRKLPFGDQ